MRNAAVDQAGAAVAFDRGDAEWSNAVTAANELLRVNIMSPYFFVFLHRERYVRKAIVLRMDRD